MRTSTSGARAAVAAMLLIALGLSISACGGSDASADNEKVTLTIASASYPGEPIILGEIYSQALADAGYTVKKELGRVGETQAQKALLAGQISGYPLSPRVALLYFFGIESGEVPTSEQKAYDLVKAELEKEGLTAFPPTPYVNAYAVGALQKTAERLGLKNVSDLKGKAEGLTLSGAPECPELANCLVGLEKGYGLKFKAFYPRFITSRYAVLNSGKADLSMLYTTDAQLSGQSKYIALEDDKHIFPAGNATAFLTTQKVADKAGPDFEKTIVDVQKGLTLSAIRKLNAKVELEGKNPEAVARQYLESGGYVG